MTIEQFVQRRIVPLDRRNRSPAVSAGLFRHRDLLDEHQQDTPVEEFPAALASGPLAQLLAPSAWIVSITEANTSVLIFLPSFAARDTARVVASIAMNLTTTNENRARSKTTAVGVTPTPITASQCSRTARDHRRRKRVGWQILNTQPRRDEASGALVGHVSTALLLPCSEHPVGL
jgi:hypothetical protein